MLHYNNKLLMRIHILVRARGLYTIGPPLTPILEGVFTAEKVSTDCGEESPQLA